MVVCERILGEKFVEKFDVVIVVFGKSFFFSCVVGEFGRLRYLYIIIFYYFVYVSYYR